MQTITKSLKIIKSPTYQSGKVLISQTVKTKLERTNASVFVFERKF